jgi:hypothetical protein
VLPVVLSLLTVVCLLLTVVFLGTLRGVVELRLMLKGSIGSAAHPRLDAGYPVPDVLLRALPEPQNTALIVFISEGCEPCSELVGLLPELRADQVLACVMGTDKGEIRGRLGADVIIADSATSSRAFEELKLKATPVAVVQHGGRIIGHAQGLATTGDPTELQRWWNESRLVISEEIS